MKKAKCYDEGGDVFAEYKKALKDGTLEKPPFVDAKPKSKTINVDGKDVEVKAIEMPNLDRGEGVNIPGYGRAKPTPTQTRGSLALMKKGGKVGSASKRADGCCVKGKTKGKML